MRVQLAPATQPPADGLPSSSFPRKLSPKDRQEVPGCQRVLPMDPPALAEVTLRRLPIVPMVPFLPDGLSLVAREPPVAHRRAEHEGCTLGPSSVNFGARDCLGSMRQRSGATRSAFFSKILF